MKFHLIKLFQTKMIDHSLELVRVTKVLIFNYSYKISLNEIFLN